MDINNFELLNQENVSIPIEHFLEDSFNFNQEATGSSDSSNSPFYLKNMTEYLGDFGFPKVLDIETYNKENINQDVKIEEVKKDNLLSQKRGRKKSVSENLRIHSWMEKDNVLRKIQVHYFKFLLQFINLLIKILIPEKEDEKSYQFNDIGYKEKLNITKNFRKKLKNKTIGQILSNEASTKYKKSPTENLKIYFNVVDKNETLKNILSQNYLEFFEEIFYKSKREINLAKYGENKTIFLTSDILLFKNLCSKMLQKAENEVEKVTFMKKVEKFVSYYISD